MILLAFYNDELYGILSLIAIEGANATGIIANAHRMFCKPAPSIFAVKR